MHGAVASPYDAANGLRGIRTLGIRTERQNQSALILARSLEGHAKIKSVSHPFLESHPQHELAREQMRLGGTVIAVEISGDFDDCKKLVSQLQIVRIATSFGGPETLVCHPASSTHVGLSEEALATMGVTDGLLRFSVGLEDADDLVDDIHRALATL
jgi:cystathionine beta-lyase/cystathionine gamma-synthase